MKFTELGLAEGTVRIHLSNVFEKLGVPEKVAYCASKAAVRRAS